MTGMAIFEMTVPNEFDSYESDEDFIFVEAAIHEFDYDNEALPNREAPDFSWAAIELACKRLLDKGRDIRVLIWRIRAHLALMSLAGLRETAALLADYLKAAPAEIRPFAADDATTIELHALHLGWLTSPEFIHQLGNLHPATLSATLADFARGKNTTPPDYPDARQLDGELEQITASLLEAADAFDQRGGSFDVDPVVHLLKQVRAALNRNLAQALPATPAAPSAEASGEPSATDLRAYAATPGAITSRQEVASTLERVSEYFRQYEPGHPALLFLSRVQRMLGASFEEILAELYAEGPALAAQLGRPGSSAN
jgi:type VI secretion system protein ImpA